jgi:hypothetical protein
MGEVGAEVMLAVQGRKPPLSPLFRRDVSARSTDHTLHQHHSIPSYPLVDGTTSRHSRILLLQSVEESSSRRTAWSQHTLPHFRLRSCDLATRPARFNGACPLVRVEKTRAERLNKRSDEGQFSQICAGINSQFTLRRHL